TALKDIVPAGVMGRAQAANQGRGAALQLGAAPLGGLLLGIGGWLVGLAVLFCHSTAAIAAWMLGRGAPRKDVADAAAASVQESEITSARAAFFAELISGFTWNFSRLDLRGVLWASTIINLGF